MSVLSEQALNEVAATVAAAVVTDIIIITGAMIQHGASGCLYSPAIQEKAHHLRARRCQLQIPMGSLALGNWTRTLPAPPGSVGPLAPIRSGSFQSAPDPQNRFAALAVSLRKNIHYVETR